MERDAYTGHDDATAAEMVQGIILTATRQVEKKGLKGMSYKLKASDQFGNTVEIEGTIDNDFSGSFTVPEGTDS